MKDPYIADTGYLIEETGARRLLRIKLSNGATTKITDLPSKWNNIDAMTMPVGVESKKNYIYVLKDNNKVSVFFKKSKKNQFFLIIFVCI